MTARGAFPSLALSGIPSSLPWTFLRFIYPKRHISRVSHIRRAHRTAQRDVGGCCAREAWCFAVLCRLPWLNCFCLINVHELIMVNDDF